MEQFNYSKIKLKKANHHMFFLVLPMLSLFIIGFSIYIAYTTGDKIHGALIIAFITFLISSTILITETFLLNRQFRKRNLFIYEDKMVKQKGKTKSEIFLTDIIKIKVIKNPKDETSGIWIYQKNKRQIWLAGFNEMGKIEKLIKQNITDNALIETKRNKINARNSILIIGSFAGTMILMCIITAMGRKAIDIFSIILALSVGVWALLYRPFSKFDISEKWLDIIFGGVMFILGISGVIVFLLIGGLT